MILTIEFMVNLLAKVEVDDHQYSCQAGCQWLSDGPYCRLFPAKLLWAGNDLPRRHVDCVAGAYAKEVPPVWPPAHLRIGATA